MAACGLQSGRDRFHRILIRWVSALAAVHGCMGAAPVSVPGSLPRTLPQKPENRASRCTPVHRASLSSFRKSRILSWIQIIPAESLPPIVSPCPSDGCLTTIPRFPKEIRVFVPIFRALLRKRCHNGGVFCGNGGYAPRPFGAYESVRIVSQDGPGQVVGFSTPVGGVGYQGVAGVVLSEAGGCPLELILRPVAADQLLGGRAGFPSCDVFGGWNGGRRG